MPATGLLRSFRNDTEDAYDVTLPWHTHCRDQAMALVAACALGQKADAIILLQGLRLCYYAPTDPMPYRVPLTVRTRNGYESNLCIHTETQFWCAYALLFFAKTYPATGEAATAKTLADNALTTLLAVYRVTLAGSQKGSFSGGTGRYVAGVYDPAWQVPASYTKDNIIAWFTLRLAVEILGDLTYATALASVQSFLLSSYVWNPVENRGNLGVSPLGVNAGRDLQSSGALLSLAYRAMNENTRADRALEECANYIQVQHQQNRTVNGFAAYIYSNGLPSTGICVEGSFQVAAAYMAGGFWREAFRYYNSLLPLLQNDGFPLLAIPDLAGELHLWTPLASLTWATLAAQPNGTFSVTNYPRSTDDWTGLYQIE